MENFKTSDINVAAALLTEGIHAKEVDSSDPSRVMFIYEPNQYLDIIVFKHKNGTFLVNSLAFSKALKHIKSTIYDKQHGGERRGFRSETYSSNHSGWEGTPEVF